MKAYFLAEGDEQGRRANAIEVRPGEARSHHRRHQLLLDVGSVQGDGAALSVVSGA